MDTNGGRYASAGRCGHHWVLVARWASAPGDAKSMALHSLCWILYDDKILQHVLSLTMKIMKYRAHDIVLKCWKLKDHIILRYFPTYPIQVVTLEVAKQIILEIHFAEKRKKETYKKVGKCKQKEMDSKKKKEACWKRWSKGQNKLTDREAGQAFVKDSGLRIETEMMQESTDEGMGRVRSQGARLDMTLAYLGYQLRGLPPKQKKTIQNWYSPIKWLGASKSCHIDILNPPKQSFFRRPAPVASVPSPPPSDVLVSAPPVPLGAAASSVAAMHPSRTSRTRRPRGNVRDVGAP